MNERIKELAGLRQKSICLVNKIWAEFSEEGIKVQKDYRRH